MPRAVFKALAVIYLTVILIGVSVGPALHALLANLIWSNTRLGEHRILCAMSPWRMIWIGVGNFVLIAVTLGLFIPWAMVRLTRYQIESMQFIPAGDLQEFVAAEPETISAVGMETAGLFDFDIAL